MTSSAVRSFAACWIIIASGMSAATCGRAQAQTLTTTRIAFGLTQPTSLTSPPGDTHRLFVTEKTGRIRIIKDGVLLPTPFLDMVSLVNSSTLEWGLLSVCFDPLYASNGYFYVNYNTGTGGDSVIARFTVTGDPATSDVAAAATRYQILYLPQPNANHRGGWLAFGPDGYLYDSQGDGGGQNDPSNRGQNITLLQGKILRLDIRADAFPADPNKNYTIPPTNPLVGVAGAAGEIFAYGLRNPWKCSFDRQTWDLWIGDVGQNQREEVNIIPAGTSGQNFGWRCMEGTTCTGMSGCTCNDPSLKLPVHEYTHSVGASITGGYVYRGCAIPALRGTYFFAEEWVSPYRIWSFQYAGANNPVVTERTTELAPGGGLSIATPVAFGEDALGELYIVDYGGEIYKIIPRTSPADCNSNGRADSCDLATGVSYDINQDGVPDECRCPADWNGNGTVEPSDLANAVNAWFNSVQAGNLSGDFDHNGSVTPADVAAFVTSWYNALSGGC